MSIRISSQSEHNEQVALFQWAALSLNKYPELTLLHASANGGKRDIVTARKLKDAGIKAGVPDIFLPVARKGFYGLWIELKVGKNKLTKKQAFWIESLRMKGYKAVMCIGWMSARTVIEEYLEKGSKNTCLSN